MGNLGQISLDPVLDKTPIYPQVLQTYKWSTKLREHAQAADSILNRQAPKRTYGHISVLSKKRKTPPSSHTYNPVHVDKFFDTWQKNYTSVEVKRVQQSPNVFQVTLGRTLQVVLVLQSFIIERVIVRAHHEVILQVDGTLDLWTQSKYAVFRKITDHATSAMLNFHFMTMPELSVKSFMLWLNSYLRLFTMPCKKCGRILKGNMPPTWRDFVTLSALHESCRQ
ncbi:putative mediator of RNA polymerase II transcription subunit 27 [Apostichopus japonicus]|uniref:Putative mediator of RNA polymerase II transcription subunit 27 n=2 Tax=Stichopus japonicus TaxID=307972 RepID=A0A2G8LP84_STIJA|nr:putative mediator of RNA polymerase II transcription subunit 27 [Apostichopus japonicus]